MSQLTHLQSLFPNQSDKYSSDAFLIVDNQTLSFSNVEELINIFSSSLVKLGFKKGDRVAWLLPNSLEAIVTTFACYKLGLIAVPLNYRYVANDIDYAINKTKPKVVVYHDTRTKEIESLKQIDDLIRICCGDSANEPLTFNKLVKVTVAEDVTFPCQENDPALIMFTSGSTGKPKGVTFTHSNLHHAIQNSRDLFNFNRWDTVLICKPLSHAGGLLTQFSAALKGGAKIVLENKLHPKEVAEKINTHNITEYGMLAGDLQDFIEYFESHPTSMPSLNNGIGSGDKVKKDLGVDLLERQEIFLNQSVRGSENAKEASLW